VVNPTNPHIRERCTNWSYTLTGLTNYVPYNIILNARIGSTPVLTGTVTVMPTDLRVYLPLVLGE